jgi:glycosyltransferase involved in cell wall biosynthesis
VTDPETGLRVAVLVACHDDGATIRETLDSLRSEPEIELVVVDDGSTDAATHEELTRAEDEGIRVLRKRNGGPSSAWMAGVEATTARYVMPFSSDDVLLAGSTHLLADALDSTPDAGFAWGDMETFGMANAYRPSVPALCPWLVTYANAMPAYSLFRRSTLLEVGGWRDTTASEDWDLWMRLAAHGVSGAYVDHPIYLYRRGAGGRFQRRGARYEPYFEDLREHNRQLFEHRTENRAASPTPRALKLLIPLVDKLPRVPRQKKIQLSEAVTLLFWSGGLKRTAHIVTQGVLFRARLALRRRSTRNSLEEQEQLPR